MTLRVRCGGAGANFPRRRIDRDRRCVFHGDALDGDDVTFDVVPETLRRTTLGERVAGDAVNVEYALRLGDRIGGHFVYGHIDAIATVVSRRSEGQGEVVRFERPPHLAFALVDKAFVALDGVSVTVAGAGPDWFDVALIPETLGSTMLGARPAGTELTSNRSRRSIRARS